MISLYLLKDDAWCLVPGFCLLAWFDYDDSCAFRDNWHVITLDVVVMPLALTAEAEKAPASVTLALLLISTLLLN